MSPNATDKMEKRHRVQLDFSEAAFEELKRLQDKLDLSRSEVMRNALGVLVWLVKHHGEGNQIVVERQDGERVLVEFPFLPR